MGKPAATPVPVLATPTPVAAAPASVEAAPVVAVASTPAAAVPAPATPAVPEAAPATTTSPAAVSPAKPVTTTPTPKPSAVAATTAASTTTTVVGTKVVPVSAAPAVTSDSLRTNPKLDELRALIERVKNNDPSLKELNLNNNEYCNYSHGIAVAEALETNTSLKGLQMVNCKLTNPVAEAFAKMIGVNKTLELLNLESNDFSGTGIKAIAEALPVNTTLLELKLTNQRSMTGTDAERQLAIALETNMTLVKLVLPIKDAGSRFSIDRAIQRNAELARKKKAAAATKK